MSRYCVVVVLIGIFLVLSAVDSASLELKVNEAVRIDSVFKIDPGTKKLESVKDSRVNGSQDSVSKSGGVRIDSVFKIDPKLFGKKKLESVKDAQVNGSQDNVSKSEGNEELGSKDGSSVRNSGKEVIPEAKGKDLGDNVDAKKEKLSGNVDKKGLGNEGGRTGAKDGFKGDVVLSKEKSGDNTGEVMVTKDGFRREECDQSTMCEDNDKKFVACLQVPGNESPDIFLLIKNKGKGPRTITISAPAFVHLEKNEVQVPEKEDQKVKVSIGEGGTSHVIVIKEGNSQCSLDYSGQDTAEISAKPYTNFATSTRFIVIVFLSVFVVMLVSVWACFTIRKKQFLRRFKYQRMDNEVLPISTPVKADSGGNDGWDDSWGDSWDDEEAPHTPSLPLTPSLSSKGLASRRLSKEGWKD